MVYTMRKEIFNKKTMAVPLVILVGGLASYFLGSYQPEVEVIEQEKIIQEVEFISLQAKTVSIPIFSQGIIRPSKKIDIIARVSGEVKMLSPVFDSGYFFNAGDTLLLLDKEEFEFELIRKEASLTQAQQGLLLEKARAQSQPELKSTTMSKVAKYVYQRGPQVADAEAKVQAASADRNDALLKLSRTSITAPFNGGVIEKFVDEGQYVTRGEKIATIYSSDSVEIKLPITDQQLAFIDAPLSYTDYSSAAITSTIKIGEKIQGKTFEWEATAVRMEASVDEQSRVHYLIARIENPFQGSANNHRPRLAIGQFVYAEISGKKIENVYKIPRHALFRDNSIYTITKNNHVTKLTVEVIKTHNDVAYVKSTFPPNTHVIVSHLQSISEGVLVTPLDAKEQIALK